MGEETIKPIEGGSRSRELVTELVKLGLTRYELDDLYFEVLLEYYGGNKTHAAQASGMSLRGFRGRFAQPASEPEELDLIGDEPL